MGRSSSGSWRGGAAPDIIDLDRFMRAGVRPSDPISTDDELCERLVVDAGAGRKPIHSSVGGARVAARDVVRGEARGSSKESSRVHHKRYSHDSGLSASGDSYARRTRIRTRKPHRQLSVVNDPGRTSRDSQSLRKVDNSSNSVQAFRTVCERALLDQQQQIARVTQLCERLTEQRAEPRVEQRAAEQSASADTSEISSSSRSTRDQRRKDKPRTEECKTYKIIMNKLDELNRLFVSRARSPPAPRHRRASSSSSVSVSVCDKPISAQLLTKRHLPTAHPPQVLVERAVGDGSMLGSTLGSAFGSQKRRVVRAVTQACSLDIAPTGTFSGNQKNTPNVTMESVVKRDCSCEGSVSSRCDPRCDPPCDLRCDLRCGYDLDDPMHLHATADRAQDAHSTERRPLLDERRAERRGELSLCALCRGCWRSVRQYVAGQIFCRPDCL